jgi:5-methylcytosine-specific restriction endonuclease McrA
MRLLKPSYHVAKAIKQRDAAYLKRAARLHKKRMLRVAEDAVREVVYKRDKGQCRCCGRALKLHGISLLDVMHAHHVIYRSAGGSDHQDNRLSLCAWCHEAEHHALLMIAGEPKKIVTFTRVTEFGKVIRQWESAA